MKLLFVTCLKEYQSEVAAIFSKANIHVFSATKTTGFRDNQQPDIIHSWFSSGDEKFDSIFLYSFTDDDNADNAMELVKSYNASVNSGFPIRAFILPVEKSSY